MKLLSIALALTALLPACLGIVSANSTTHGGSICPFVGKYASNGGGTPVVTFNGLFFEVTDPGGGKTYPYTATADGIIHNTATAAPSDHDGAGTFEPNCNAINWYNGTWVRINYPDKADLAADKVERVDASRFSANSTTHGGSICPFVGKYASSGGATEVVIFNGLFFEVTNINNSTGTSHAYTATADGIIHNQPGSVGTFEPNCNAINWNIGTPYNGTWVRIH
jgi:hypothetical protein